MASEVGKLRREGQSGAGHRQFTGEPDAPLIGDWLRFQKDGTVLLLAGKAEVGQGIRTSLAMAVAEELRLPLERVRTLFGDTAITPYDMGTVGSRSTPILDPLLHKVAASARELFIDRAAERWGVDRSEIRVADGRVSQPQSGRSLTYSEMAGEDGYLRERWSEDVPVTPPDQWSVAGKSTLRASGREFVTGRHQFTSDLSRPGMLVGVVLRPPAFSATLLSLDAEAVMSMPGVTVVQEGSFVGVVAPNAHSARQAAAAIRAEWHMPDPLQQVSDKDIYDYIKAHPAEPDPQRSSMGPSVIELGSLDEGRAVGRTFEATYTTPYIAHAPLEPRAALAEWERDNLTVWTGTQRPFGVRVELANTFGMPEAQVRVIVPDTGGGYGGKHTGDAAIEAARLARAVGRPVKVVWSREEEFTWAYFRPAALIEISSAVAPDGLITAWEYHNYNSGSQAMRPPYAIANQLVAFHPSVSPLRQGSYRALAATANHFARESHIDELAHLVGMDPLEFRLRNLPGGGGEVVERVRAVLLAAAERFGWQERRSSRDVPGRGYGMAYGTEKESYVATCAEVEVDTASGHMRVVRVVEAFECGAIVNPEGLSSQVEGAIIQALGGALMERVEFAEGKVLSNRFSRYRVPRFSDTPEVELVLVDRKDLPSKGAGETPIVGLAPALANAIFDATGVRLRSLPLTLRSE